MGEAKLTKLPIVEENFLGSMTVFWRPSFET